MGRKSRSLCVLDEQKVVVLGECLDAILLHEVYQVSLSLCSSSIFKALHSCDVYGLPWTLSCHVPFWVWAKTQSVYSSVVLRLDSKFVLRIKTSTLFVILLFQVL